MAGVRVICNNCGREFDPTAERSVYDQASQSYICSRCLARPGTQTKTKPRTTRGNALRIVFGVLFILSAITSAADGDGSGTWLTCLVIGLGLLIWQFWPQLKALFMRKQLKEALLKQQQEYDAREAERLAREKARRKICPHCGATTAGFTCEYCGMPLDHQ